MNVPYDKLTLQVAMLGASNKLVAYEEKNGSGSIEKKLEELKLTTPPTEAMLNQQAADHHGISVLALINSTNYVVLKDEYGEFMAKEVIVALKDTFGLEDKEAWAIVVSNQLGN